MAQKKLRKKSVLLTAYLAVLFKSSKYYVPVDQVSTHESNNADKKRFRPGFTIITPEQEHLRGAQLSILLLPRNYGLLKPTMQCLEYAGVLPDEREPDVIRFSPVPFYNTFRDCWIAASTFDWALKVSRSVCRKEKREQRTSGLCVERHLLCFDLSVRCAASPRQVRHEEGRIRERPCDTGLWCPSYVSSRTSPR